jgi:hypothetical protein
MLISRRRVGGGRSHACPLWGTVQTTLLTGSSRDLTGGRILPPRIEGKVVLDCRELLADIHKEVAL